MGILDFKNQKHHLTRIRRILSRRGLVPDLREQWEIHGPHSDMDYQVYVGYAVPSNENEKCRTIGCNLSWKKCKRHSNDYCVAIYPKAVYEIDEPSDWAKYDPENRLPVLS